MTDAEIVAYNVGIAWARAHPGRAPDHTSMAMALRGTMAERERAAVERLGGEMFLAWAQKGAWAAYTGAAR
ncbi:MAG: hypothetical protein ACYCSJ_01395 [Acidimicrobiales bacterium]